MELRRNAIKVMGGRAWTHGGIGLDLIIYAPALHEGKRLDDYIAGVFDTLDGSSGRSFTYLPVVYEDDCQICQGSGRFVESIEDRYTITIHFL